MAAPRKVTAPGGRPPVELQKVMQSMAARATRADTALREALTALRQGKHRYALEVLEAYDMARVDEGHER